MMSKKIKRDLKTIGTELQTALKDERENLFHIGELLIEAKAQLEHGGWLQWLKENFGASHATASNYMNAAKLAAKFPTVRSLKLRATALYLISKNVDDPDGLYCDETVEAILAEAKTQWVDDDRAKDIAYDLDDKRREAEAERKAEAEAERTAEDEAEQYEEQHKGEEPEEEEPDDDDADALLDGKPPELPPTSEATTIDLESFDQAVATLVRLQTKPLSKFVETKQGAALRDVIDFLRDLAKAIP
jgi:hypothetical protein